MLDSVCVDCSKRMISWSVANSLSDLDMNSSISDVITQQLRKRITFNGSIQPGSPTTVQPVKDKSSSLEHSVSSLDSTVHNHTPAVSHSSPLHDSTPPPLGQGGSPQSQASLNILFHSPLRGGSPGGEGGTHSFMAPHDGDISLCSDDLQNLFELAKELFGVHSSSLINGEMDLVREGRMERGRGGGLVGEGAGWEGQWERRRAWEGEGGGGGQRERRKEEGYTYLPTSKSCCNNLSRYTLKHIHTRNSHTQLTHTTHTHNSHTQLTLTTHTHNSHTQLTHTTHTQLTHPHTHNSHTQLTHTSTHTTHTHNSHRSSARGCASSTATSSP